MNLVRLAASVAVCLLSVSSAFGAGPFDFDTNPGRLPKNVVPLDYEVSLVPHVDTLSLTGNETVRLQFRSATAAIQFNSLNEKLDQVSFDGTAVQSVESDDAKQLTTVTLMRPAGPGVHTLSFAFTGKVETAPHGLFAQSYTRNDGSKSVLLSTQMEATDARRMFPCWDEPAFRASIHLAVSIPAAWASLSNMPIVKRELHGDLATVSFAATPKMPTYLIEFTAGELRELSARNGNTDFGVWAVAGQESEGVTALRNAQQILGDYNEYFAFPYPLPKLDSIAVPGGFSGAMENWGAITYNDRLLLVSAASAIPDLQTVFSVQAHEMAHQWFGDLVTMAWWEQIWLNESFASWLAAKETAARNPSWHWWESEDDSRETALRADARAASHPIERPVLDELQADESFDPDITYSKGEALLRMLESYLGESVFRDGIRRYVKARAYSNATSTDLWQSLGAASGKDVGHVATDWTTRAGFPLVSVTAACDPAGARTITLHQTRFLLTGRSDKEPRGTAPWHVPLRIRAGTAAPKPVLLDSDGQQASAGRCNEPLSVNADAVGYYRVQYDAATLAANTAAFGSAPDGDRIALLDDQWALVESSMAPLKSYLALAASMHEDLDARAWNQIVGALSVIEYAQRGSPGHDAFAAFARSVLKPALQRLGWQARADEAPDVTSLRQTLMAALGSWDDPATVAEARRRFQALLKERASLTADEQSTVLDIVAQNADAATFAQLHQLAKEAANQTELRRDYLALTFVRDPALAAQVLQIALSDELPPQAATLRVRLVFRLAARFHQLSWDALTAHRETLMQPFPSNSTLILGQMVPEVYWDSLPLPQLEAWVRANVPAEAAETIERGMQTARFKLAEKQSLIPAADAFIKAQAGS
jgi:aminopeptidase N